MNKIIYLDAAASALKSDAVIRCEMDFLRHDYANAGRGVCARAMATDHMVMAARNRVARFINGDINGVIFTSGTTDAMNRIVHMVCAMDQFQGHRPVVAVSDLDHHSARMPWQHLGNIGQCDITVCALNPAFDIDCDKIEAYDVMVITAMSNVLGQAQDVGEIIRRAREKNPAVITIVDAAQYAAHCPIDVLNWDCDFMCFSGHKIGADTGLGIMYIKDPERFPVDKFGGGMVNRILENGQFQLNPAPERFESGTLPLTQIAGLGMAIDQWVAWPGASNFIGQLHDGLSRLPRINLLTNRAAALLSFTVRDMHVLDFGARMGAHNVCMRVGNMCATWVHRAMGISGSARLSVGPWNTQDDIDRVQEIIRGIVD